VQRDEREGVWGCGGGKRWGDAGGRGVPRGPGRRQDPGTPGALAPVLWSRDSRPWAHDSGLPGPGVPWPLDPGTGALGPVPGTEARGPGPGPGAECPRHAHENMTFYLFVSSYL